VVLFCIARATVTRFGEFWYRPPIGRVQGSTQNRQVPVAIGLCT